jgi:hypothetical protein
MSAAPPYDAPPPIVSVIHSIDVVPLAHFFNSHRRGESLRLPLKSQTPVVHHLLHRGPQPRQPLWPSAPLLLRGRPRRQPQCQWTWIRPQVEMQPKLTLTPTPTRLCGGSSGRQRSHPRSLHSLQQPRDVKCRRQYLLHLSRRTRAGMRS